MSNADYLNSNYGVERTNTNYIGSIDPNTGAPLLDNISEIDQGISGSLYDLITAQFLQTGVDINVSKTYASFIMESMQLSGQSYTDFFELDADGKVELTITGFAYINALRDNTSKIGIKSESEFTNLVKQSIRI